MSVDLNVSEGPRTGESGRARTGATARPQGETRGMRRAAIAVLLLGDELTRRLFRHLRPDHVRRLLAAANDLRGVTEDEVLDVLEELVGGLNRGVPGISGHGHRIEEAAVAVFGADLVRQAGTKSIGGITMRLHTVATEKPELFARTLKKEHPQTIAVILSLLPPEVGGAVLRFIDKDTKAEVVRRVAKLRSVSSAVVAEVAEHVGKEFARPSEEGPIDIDGMDMAVRLLKSAGPQVEQPVIEELERVDLEVGTQLKNRLFVFEDLRTLHDRDIQLLMREIDQRVLPLALKTASPELQAKLLGNVSKRAADLLRDDLAMIGPVTLAQVEEAQAQILMQVKLMAADGRVNLRPGTTV